ncbi:hypothetical protein BHM03_00021882 [Ensete ventricosum]|nr:hypothetical protein BHM03_00021882 [Ensete ventricosum]
MSVRSSPRVSGVCQDGARDFARRRPRLTGILSGVVEKLVGSYDGLVIDIFAKGIKKLAGNIPGDRRKTYRKNARGYRIGGSTFGWLTRPGRRVNRPYSDFSDTVRFWL